MKESVYIPVMIIGVCLSNLAINLYYLIKKKRMITRFLQPDSVEIKQVRGSIVTAGNIRLFTEWFRFDVLVNADSVFFFARYTIGNVILINYQIIHLKFVTPAYGSAAVIAIKTGLQSDNEGNMEISYRSEIGLVKRCTITLKRLNAAQVNALQLFRDNNNGDQRVLKEI